MMDNFSNSFDIPEGDMNDVMKQAIDFISRIQKVSEIRDVEKTAYCWYDLIKHTYGLANDQGILEEEREEINTFLEKIQLCISLMFIQTGWDKEMLQQFEDKIDKLWIRE